MREYLETIRNLFRHPELRKRALVVLGLLILFRLIANIPLPDVDMERLKNIFQSSQFLGLLNIFSGSALSNFSIALLGVSPYITAIIILQLLTLVFPKLKEMYYEEGEEGRRKFNRLSRILTVPLAMIQSFGFLNFLRAQGVIIFPSYFALIRDVIIITCGCIVLMWIGELISEKKLGNGISLIIFSGIVAGVPLAIQQILLTFSIQKLTTYLIFLALALFTIAGIIYINEAERRIPLTFVKRVRGMKLYGGASTYIPLRINQAGVIPIIFAISFLFFPATVSQFLKAFGTPWSDALFKFVNDFLQNQLIFSILYFVLVFAFTYLYTYIVFNPQELAENFQKSGAFIPGIRPGKETEEYLKKIVSRITFLGALFLGVIAVLPFIFQVITKTAFLSIGGTSILILVSVAIETLKQIRSDLSLRRYEI
jgi:preprotein translocase subunit SecY